MSAPSLPTGYDISKHVPAGRRDCLLTVGFDQHQRHIPRFLVQLYYRALQGGAISTMRYTQALALGVIHTSGSVLS
jgi:hypothetical protein